jgi:hypothetical protein
MYAAAACGPSVWIQVCRSGNLRAKLRVQFPLDMQFAWHRDPVGSGEAPVRARGPDLAEWDVRMGRQVGYSDAMKKFKHEAELFKAALQAGVAYAEGRKVVQFEPTDSAADKALYVYRLLVHDKLIAPMPEEQVSEKSVRHRLAAWHAGKLPKGHPLLD